MKISANILENLNQNLTTEKANNNKTDDGLFNTIFADKNMNLGSNTGTSDVYQNLKSTSKERKVRTTNNVSDEAKIQEKFKDNKPATTEKTESVSKTKEVDKTEDADKIKKLEDDAKKEAVYSEIANFLGITVDELKLKMDEMGISEDSLTSLEGVRAAVLALTGLSDPAELLNLEGVKELFSSVDEILSMSTEEVINMLMEEEGVSTLDELISLKENNSKTNSEVETENVDTLENQTISKTQTNANQVVESDDTENTAEVTRSSQATTEAQETVVETANVVNEVAEEVNVEGNKVLEVMEEINQQAVNVDAVQSVQTQSGGMMSEGQTGGNNQQNANTNSNATNTDVINNILFTQDAKGQVSTFNSIVNNKMSQNISQQEIINQIVEKMKVNVTGDTSEVRITLRPEHLGDVTLKIATHNGVVTAEFLAQSEEVKALIEANFQDLQETLRQKGLEVSSFTTGLLSDQSNSNSQSNPNRRSANVQNNGNGTLEEEAEPEVAEIKISNYEYEA